ncbi:asparaginase [Phenylobacterium sp. SCN 70-31]|uniref:asparaginase n=1 Tax=Phenylobacterium sp. SCN 70-31 TaxID=1660129 RepID=UPI00086CB203|nr:asparaginase [Phenylobacterium sp. SCN 70-31]ODT88373.1 MAG: hypothetical protein ABS78_07080 [Phenylobacterium sp. SCN 70-31]
MPRIVLLSTGGTIAMAGAGGGGGGGGGVEIALAGRDLLPSGGLGEARVEVRDLFALPSSGIGLAALRQLDAAVCEAAADGDPVVIAHGTDTLEETAFALHLLAADGPPVVLTGAMRAADAVGADGPGNLSAAIRVALEPQARGLGALVVFGDEIHAAPFVRKTHAFRPAAFSSAPLGPIGWVVEDRVRLVMRPALQWPALAFGPADPRTHVLSVNADTEPDWVYAAAAGADGVVLELSGGGHAPGRLAGVFGEIAGRIPLVFASRTGGGETLRSSYGYSGAEMDLLARGLIPAGLLDARKARIALALLLSREVGIEDVRAWFASV